MHYVDNQSKSVLIGERIFNETELNSRLEVELEKYTMKVQIEGRVLGDLAINHQVPTAVTYQNRLLENLCKMKEIFSPEEFEVLSADRKELIREISAPCDLYQSTGTRNDRSPESSQPQRQLQRKGIRIRRKGTSLPR